MQKSLSKTKVDIINPPCSRQKELGHNLKQDKAAQTTEEKSFTPEKKELKLDLVPLIKIPFEFDFKPVDRAQRKSQPQSKFEALDPILGIHCCKSEELLPIPKNCFLNICSISQGEQFP